MNLFFGKISAKREKSQLTEGYYRATRDSSWFNGIQPGDYCFMIGGKKIQLWKAESWGKKDGDDILAFAIIHADLGINTKKLAAIKYFNLTMELVVLTVRSTAKSKRAFFPIEHSDQFTEAMLKDSNTYKEEKIFRRIQVLPEGQQPIDTSTDIQLFKKNGEWSIYPGKFIAESILESFKDNTGMLGSGQDRKDETINTIQKVETTGGVLPPEEMSILQLYDLFCCSYKSKEISFRESDSWVDEEGEESELELAVRDECNIILYGPPGTGKTYEVISFIDELDSSERLGVQIEPKGNLDLNRTFWHLAPGRNGYLWNDLKNGNRLGYEWCGKELGDLKLLDSSVESYKIRRRFSHVKQGDYFCIIRGRHCLGIAEAMESYEYERAIKGSFDFQTIEVKWLAQFGTPVLLNTSSTMTFSGINGGQRWKALLEGLTEEGFTFGSEIREKPVFRKLYKFTTFHQSYSYEDFVEGIKPRLSEETNDDESEQIAEIEYEIKPGVFYYVCDKAAQLAGYSDLQAALKDTKEGRADSFSKAQPYYMIVDEINRGNVANIFGELITLIEKDKRLGNQQETLLTLPYSKDDFGVPANLILIGTMNTADRSIEALDSALRRRFAFIEKAPVPELLTKHSMVSDKIDLKAMLRAINSRIELLLDKDHLIGHSYFMDIKTVEDMVSAFKNKVVPLLEEYFYGRPQMVGMVLGPAFVEEQEPVNLFTEFETESLDLQEKKRFKVRIPETWADYKAIYGSDSSL